MRARSPFCLLCLLLIAIPATAGVIGKIAKYEGLKAEALAGLPESQRKPWQDYLALSQAARQADLAALAAERKGLVQVPAPVGDSLHDKSMPLDRPASWYSSAEARHIADVIVSFQTPSGGWGKNQDFSKAARLPGQLYVPVEEAAITHPEDFGNPSVKTHYFGTIDNDATTTQLRFLAKTIAQAGSTNAVAWRTSFVRGQGYLFAAELPGGGWPQIWPLEGGYHDALTFNDNAFANVASLLADVASNAGGLYGFVPPEMTAKASAAEKRARTVLLATQVSVNGKRAVWGQQHDPLTLKPVAARNFEPAMLSATESASLLVFLMSLPDPTADEIAAVHGGIAWLKSATITNKAWKTGPNGHVLVDEAGSSLWARFYDAQTMKPVFGDRDMTIHDDVNDIDPERRDGYSWYNTGPAKALKRYESWTKKLPAN